MNIRYSEAKPLRLLLWVIARRLQDILMPKSGDPANESFRVLIGVCTIFWASLVVQMVKNLPGMQETWA